MASLSRNFTSYCFRRSSIFWTSLIRRKSDAHVVMTDDSSTIVCWHPEPHFPYEKSLPIPEKEIVKNDSILKVQSVNEFLSVLKPKRQEVVIEELRRLTFSTKHIWYPKKDRRKPRPEPDRPYL